MGETDFFGTFLDTLQSSTVEPRLNAFGRSAPASPPRSAPTSRDGSDVYAWRSGIAVSDTNAADTTDRVFRKMAELDKVGSLPADLTKLIPADGSSLSLLLDVISRLEKFGVVERTIDGRIDLTDVGHRLATSVS